MRRTVLVNETSMRLISTAGKIADKTCSEIVDALVASIEIPDKKSVSRTTYNLKPETWDKIAQFKKSGYSFDDMIRMAILEVTDLEGVSEDEHTIN